MFSQRARTREVRQAAELRHGPRFRLLCPTSGSDSFRLCCRQAGSYAVSDNGCETALASPWRESTGPGAGKGKLTPHNVRQAAVRQDYFRVASSTNKAVGLVDDSPKYLLHRDRGDLQFSSLR